MEKNAKLKQAIELYEAKKKGNSEFILLKKLDDIDDKMVKLEQMVGDIKPTDVSDVRKELQRIKEELQNDLEIELQII